MMKDVDYFNKGSSYAKRIRERRVDIMHKTNLIEHHRDIMRDIEAEILANVNSDVNDKGKKTFTNEMVRQAELRKRLRTHGDYNVSKDLIAVNSGEISEMVIGIEFFQGMLRLVTAFLH